MKFGSTKSLSVVTEKTLKQNKKMRTAAKTAAARLPSAWNDSDLPDAISYDIIMARPALDRKSKSYINCLDRGHSVESGFGTRYAISWVFDYAKRNNREQAMGIMEALKGESLTQGFFGCLFECELPDRQRGMEGKTMRHLAMDGTKIFPEAGMTVRVICRTA